MMSAASVGAGNTNARNPSAIARTPRKMSNHESRDSSLDILPYLQMLQPERLGNWDEDVPASGRLHGHQRQFRLPPKERLDFRLAAMQRSRRRAILGGPTRPPGSGPPYPELPLASGISASRVVPTPGELSTDNVP